MKEVFIIVAIAEFLETSGISHFVGASTYYFEHVIKYKRYKNPKERFTTKLREAEHFPTSADAEKTIKTVLGKSGLALEIKHLYLVG